MTQEDKGVLLKDLCARFPYNTFIQVYYFGKEKKEELTSYNFHLFMQGEIDILPYLRPMSSMTEEEDKEYALLQVNTHNSGFLYSIDAANMINWLNAHHFDYCWLIEKGLALEAPKEMYEI